MVKYNKEKHMLLELQKVTKTDLKAVAIKESRTVNNWINVAIEEKLERHYKEK